MNTLREIGAPLLREYADVLAKLDELEIRMGYRSASLPNGAIIDVPTTKTSEQIKREKAAAYQRARYRQLKEAKLAKTTIPAKRIMSAAARKAISESAKARWQKARRSGANSLARN